MKAIIDKTFWCDAGQFRGMFFYGLCPSEKAWKKDMKRFNTNLDYPTSAGRCTFLTNEKGKRCVIVTFKDGIEDELTAIEFVALLAHEAVHVWQELTDAIHESEPSPEFEAYYVQWIIINLMEEFKNCGRGEYERRA